MWVFYVQVNFCEIVELQWLQYGNISHKKISGNLDDIVWNNCCSINEKESIRQQTNTKSLWILGVSNINATILVLISMSTRFLPCIQNKSLLIDWISTSYQDAGFVPLNNPYPNPKVHRSISRHIQQYRNSNERSGLPKLRRTSVSTISQSTNAFAIRCSMKVALMALVVLKQPVALSRDDDKRPVGATLSPRSKSKRWVWVVILAWIYWSPHTWILPWIRQTQTVRFRGMT